MTGALTSARISLMQSITVYSGISLFVISVNCPRRIPRTVFEFAGVFKMVHPFFYFLLWTRKLLR